MNLVTFVMFVVLSVCMSKTLATEFPTPCEENTRLSLAVARGENVRLSKFLEECGLYWNTGFAWYKGGTHDLIGRCVVNDDKQCIANATTKFHLRMKIDNGYIYGGVHFSYNCYFEIDITYFRHENLDLYGLIHEEENCTLLTANVTVRETEPMCETFYFKESSTLQYSCKWIPRDINESIKFLFRNHAIYSYENNGMTNSNGSWHINNEVRVSIKLDRVFSYRFGSRHVCSYSIWL